MKKKSRLFIILVSFFLMGSLFNSISTANHIVDDGYYTIVSESGKHILKTARNVIVGDYYINEKNEQYRVIEVDSEKQEAIAELEKEVNLRPKKKSDTNNELSLNSKSLAVEAKNSLVAVYNTHTAESYEPTRGTDSVPGDGDVINIAAQLSSLLEERGVDVVHDQSRHEPHDGGSYERSRRTAENLAQKSPAVLLDIHRDGVPDAEEYTTEIDGERVAQVKFVIGRQNPQLEANDEFAKYFKAVSDEHYPGLVKGIFYADGKYNQDLSPRSLLIENGTHTQPIEMVEGSLNNFADVIVDLLGRMDDDGIGAERNIGGDILRNILLLLALVLGGGFLLLAANEKGFAGAVAKIKNTFQSLIGKNNNQ